MTGSRTVTASDSDRSLMYGNGMARIDGQRRQHGEDLVEEARAHLDVALRTLLVADDADLLVGQLAARTAAQVSECAATMGSSRVRIASRVCAALIPSGVGLERPAATCCFRPATRIWKNSSRLLAKMARKRDPLEQRVALVDRLVQHALVELEPRQLAVDVRDVRSHARRRGVACAVRVVAARSCPGRRLRSLRG